MLSQVSKTETNIFTEANDLSENNLIEKDAEFHAVTKKVLRSHANFDFMLLFCRMQVLSYFSAHWIFYFATSSLPSPSCFAKGP